MREYCLSEELEKEWTEYRLLHVHGELDDKEIFVAGAAAGRKATMRHLKDEGWINRYEAKQRGLGSFWRS